MAATPLSYLVLLSQQRTFLYAERVRTFRAFLHAKRVRLAQEIARTGTRAIMSAACKAYITAGAGRVRLTQQSARASRRAMSAAWKAYIAADEAYLKEACRVIEQRSIVVHSQQEIEVLMAIFEIYEQPFRLKRVIVNGQIPGERMDTVVEEMRETLLARGFALVEGNTYSVPNLKPERGVTGEEKDRREDRREE